MPKYIDIEKEINEMEKVLEEHKDDTSIGFGFASGAFRLFIDELKSIPAADVSQIVHAKWIPVTNSRGGHKCSLCHSYAPSFVTGDEWLTDYCPNCGAKIDKQIEDEDIPMEYFENGGI